MTDHKDHDDLFEHEPLPEGEEQAPPYTHTMAIVRWFIFAGMLLFAVVMVLSYFELTPWATAQDQNARYHCPMHPTYISAQPGDCPICGMSLVEIGAEVDVDSAAQAEHGADHATGQQGKESVAEPGQYYCPMDPEVASDTEGKCPMCGMFLEKFEPGMKFTCEMHPEVVTEKPGDCPKCGMDLIPMESGEGADHQSHSGAATESNVPGLVEITLAPERLQLIGIKTDKVQRQALDASSQAVGFVTADEQRLSTIAVRFSGWVKELYINQTGEQVKAGVPLMSVYSQELYQAEQEYLIARESASRPINDPTLGNMRKDLLTASEQRLRLLGLPDEEFKRLNESGKASAEITIRSPFSGVAIEKNVVAGQYIGPDQPLFRLADLRSVWVIADIYEQSLGGVRENSPAQVSLSAYPGETFSGRVDFIYPTVAESGRTLKVRVSVDNAAQKIKPGMYANVTFSGQAQDILAVPASAVMSGSRQQYVFVVHSGGHFTPRLVTTGQNSGDFIEVIAGLSEGDEVVTSANFLIDSESRLQAAISGMSAGTPADPHAGHGK